MLCPYCASTEVYVVDSREANEGMSIRRRRACTRCKKRFTTYENAVLDNITVIKKNGTRESFDKNKVLVGIVKACEKRDVSRERMDLSADKIERRIRASGRKEIQSKDIGEFTMRELAKLDSVAYIRFASVYHEFESPREFISAIRAINKPRK